MGWPGGGNSALWEIWDLGSCTPCTEVLYSQALKRIPHGVQLKGSKAPGLVFESRAPAQGGGGYPGFKEKGNEGKIDFLGVIKEPPSITKHELFVALPEESRSCKQVM